MRARGALVTVAAGLAAGAAVAAAYPRLGRAWCLHWGATPAEVDEVLPGDEFLDHPDIVSTRAVTVDAPPSAIWPWLVQLGPGRGGAYTYDWIENLFGLDMHSADAILPEFQDLAVGDVQALGKSGPRLRVETLERDHTMVLRSEDGNWVWAFVLQAGADDGDSSGGTRLVSRNRISAPDAGAFGRLMNTLVMEPGSLLMERKMLLGLKERAERTPAA